MVAAVLKVDTEVEGSGLHERVFLEYGVNHSRTCGKVLVNYKALCR